MTRPAIHPSHAMPQFLIGFSLPHLILAAWSVVWLLARAPGSGQTPPDPWSLILTVLAVPLFAAWALAELVQVCSPRRLLDPRLHEAPRRLALGLAAGAASCTLSAIGLALLDARVPESATAAASALIPVATALLPLGRLRPGFCIHCNYDTRGTPTIALCPECGARQ